MGLSLRFLVFPEHPGRAVGVPTSKMERVWLGKEPWPEYAGQELKALEVVVEVEKRRVLNVLRVLPYRTRLGKTGARIRTKPGSKWLVTLAHQRALTNKSPACKRTLIIFGNHRTTSGRTPLG